MIEFQSAHPVRGATFFGFRILPAPLFQSTRPVWGATASHLTRRSSRRISIHAPRVGRDRLRAQKNLCCGHFNPRAPCGARRRARLKNRLRHLFQSTRPVWGATWPGRCARQQHPISIHAPRVGRDKKKGPTPQGKTISIHAPRVGRDLPPRGGGERRKKFQSTRPVWGATMCFSITRGKHIISIHAPRVGRDATASTRIWRCVTFQSTRPVWGATARPSR